MTVASASNNVDAGPWIYKDADNILSETRMLCFADAGGHHRTC